MAFTATNSTKLAAAFSNGPYKIQVLTFTAVSGDTSGTITADQLIRIDHILIDGGLKLTSATTFSTNTASIAFSDPLANAFGTVICYGK